MIFGWVILLLLIKTLRSPQLTDYNFLLKKKNPLPFWKSWKTFNIRLWWTPYCQTANILKQIYAHFQAIRKLFWQQSGTQFYATSPANFNGLQHTPSCCLYFPESSHIVICKFTLESSSQLYEDVHRIWNAVAPMGYLKKKPFDLKVWTNSYITKRCAARCAIDNYWDNVALHGVKKQTNPSPPPIHIK